MTIEELPLLNDKIYAAAAVWDKTIDLYTYDAMPLDNQLVTTELQITRQLVGIKTKIATLDTRLEEYTERWKAVPKPDLVCSTLNALTGGRYKTCQERKRMHIEEDFDFVLEHREYLLDELSVAEQRMERIDHIYRKML